MANAVSFIKAITIATAFILSGVFSGTLSGTVFADESVLSYRGDAFSLDGSTLLYTEHHQLTYRQVSSDSDKAVNEPISRITRYQDANTQEFAVKENTYRYGSATPEFNLTDTRYGYYEEVTYENDRWRASYREPTEADKGKLGKPDYTPVIDSGFDEFVRSVWPELMDGDTVRFSFAVPSRLEWVNFRLIPLKNENGTLTVEMRLSSRLLSWLLDPVKLSYDTETMRLLTYRGLTNIRDKNGEGIQAEIRYTYPD
ncbi:hypothetical protein [Thalassolituus maritimus]|uniref:DUF3108 domain-containing protein n=1 Tax=Thalassolituus maritimus TaxID=484498 RepID=A0ABQ0A0Y8_9GAMM